MNAGFSLLEMAIVLVILGFLLSQLMVPFGTQYEQGKRNSTRQQLADVIEAVTGFAVAQRRLPCPAGIDTHGLEREQCGGVAGFGFVPAVSLGLAGPIDQYGRLLDSWGHPLLYAVSQSDHPDRGETGKPDFVTAGEMTAVGLPFLASELVVCQDGKRSVCSRNRIRANQVPVVVISLGRDVSRQGHQAQNQNADSLFVLREYSDSRIEPFDDQEQYPQADSYG